MRRFRHVPIVYVVCILILLLGAAPLLAKCGHLKLHVTPKQAYVFVDDVPLGWGSGLLWATPGEHTLAVYNYGYKPYTTKFTAEVGKTSSLSVALEAIPGTVPGPWGRIELKGPQGAAVLLNGDTPDFFVANVGEASGGKRRLVVPPGDYQLTVLGCCSGTVYSGPITVGANQRTIIPLATPGEKKTADWPEGKSLGSLPRFQAETSSVAVAKPTAQISAASAQVECGGSTQLTWSSTDAPRVELSGAGEVAASGGQSVQPKQTTSYKLTATGPGGVTNSEVTVTVASNIQSSLSVTPAEIRYHKVGDKVDQQGSATLSWSAPGADTASLDPFGSVSPTGNRTVQPTPSKTDVGPIDETITYTLHSSNVCGGSDTQTASLHIVGSIDLVRGAGAEAEVLQVKLPGNSVYFPFDLPTKAKPEGGLVASQTQVLEELVTNFKQYLQFSPDAHLILNSYADVRGSVKYNITLTERRAERVRSFLVEHGINPANLQTQDFGKTQQLDTATVKQLTEQNPDLTAQDRKKVYRRLPFFVLANNRRVDFVLSTTGKRSLQYYPYKAADLKALLAEAHRPAAEAKETKTEVKK